MCSLETLKPIANIVSLHNKNAFRSRISEIQQRANSFADNWYLVFAEQTFRFQEDASVCRSGRNAVIVISNIHTRLQMDVLCGRDYAW